MFVRPMTLIVILVLAVCFVAGAAIIRRSLRNRRRVGDNVVCSRCRAANPRHARFCARCGEALE